MAGRLDDPAVRAAAARQIAMDTGGPLVTKDPLTPYEREMYVPADSVQLRIPLRNTVEMITHLGMVADVVRELLHEFERDPKSERSNLMLMHSLVRGLNHRLNAYRKRRP